ncbi:hypothetical protein SteCoe_2926 [Stentor coeruleus]|uniref:Uncharacterized protein n=1 Tax=Stentor coeruleus TaxID=5963 RepID=A0A1R2CYE3_9CILI|nr:hypothetical protein SteCoe_2926 [Stentor coeruleus]
MEKPSKIQNTSISSCILPSLKYKKTEISQVPHISRSVFIKNAFKQEFDNNLPYYDEKLNNSRSLPILPPLDLTNKIKLAEENTQKQYIDKSVGSCSPLSRNIFRKNPFQPTRVILAMAVPNKFIKNSFTRIQTKYPAENKVHQMIQKLACRIQSPDNKFKILLNGSKMNLA